MFDHRVGLGPQLVFDRVERRPHLVQRVGVVLDSRRTASAACQSSSLESSSDTNGGGPPTLRGKAGT
jgi:hypothetical protein